MQTPERRDRLHSIGRRAVWNLLGRRGAINQPNEAVLSPALQPAVGGELTDARRISSFAQRAARALDPLNQQPPAVRTGAGITVQLHPVSSLGLGGFSTAQPPRRPGCLLTNVLRNYRCLDEALCLAVGSGPIWASEDVADPELLQREGMDVRAVTGAVVGEHALDLDAERGEPGHSTR